MQELIDPQQPGYLPQPGAREDGTRIFLVLPFSSYSHIAESPFPNPSLTLHHLQRCAVTRERRQRRRKFYYKHLRRWDLARPASSAHEDGSENPPVGAISPLV
jgi:hypothetical protein